MQRCDFASIVKLIRDNLLEGNFDNQSEFLETLFASYLEESGGCFDMGLLNKWLNGLARLSPSIIQFYLKDKKHREDLTITMEDVIIPCLSDSAMVIQQVTTLLVQDPTISDRKKQELSPRIPCDSTKDEAEALTAILLFGMARPFQAHDIRKAQDDTINEKSPLIKDYILCGDVPRPCPYFCGRDKEIESLHKKLMNHEKVFVEGIPGIGKSELVKAYALKYKKEYTNMLYILYSGDIQRDIADICFADDLPSESSEERFYRHDRFLRTLKKDTLVILDNFDTKSSREGAFAHFQNYRCHILVTTRYRWPEHCRIRIGGIADDDALFQLIEQFYPDAEKHRNEILNIMWETQYHPLILELIARCLGQGKSTPFFFLSQLRIRGTCFRESEKIKLSKDGKIRRDTVTEHIRTLFDISSFSPEEQNVLRCMAMIPAYGIPSYLLGSWLKLRAMDDVNNLIDLGYLTITPENRIAMPRAVRKACVAELRPSITGCRTMLESVQEACLSSKKESEDYILILHIISGIRNIVQDDLVFYYEFLKDAVPFMKKYHDLYGMQMALLDMNRILIAIDKTERDDALYLFYMALAQKNIESKIKNALDALACLPDENAENSWLLYTIHIYLGGLYKKIENESSAMEQFNIALMYWLKYKPYQKRYDFLETIKFAYFSNIVSSPTEALASLKIKEFFIKTGNPTSYDYGILLQTKGWIQLSSGDQEGGMQSLEKAKEIFERIIVNDPTLLAEKQEEIKEIIEKTKFTNVEKPKLN